VSAVVESSALKRFNSRNKSSCVHLLENRTQSTPVYTVSYKIKCCSSSWSWKVNRWLEIQCPVTICQYFRILFLKPFPVRNVIWTWVQFSSVTELWTEIKDDSNNTKHYNRCTSGVTGHTTFQSTRGGVPWMSISLTDGLVVVSAELATTVAGLHSPSYMKNMVYEREVNRR
jgi:hypothetical protein